MNETKLDASFSTGKQYFKVFRITLDLYTLSLLKIEVQRYVPAGSLKAFTV